jgi:isopentenyl-diphosphate delta-isomerase
VSSESVVLLDAAGRAVGTAPKGEVHHGDTPLHLAFSLYLFSSEGELLLTRRADDKATFPGLWTNSVCGHPAPGEAMSDAVVRRARSELGAAVTGLRLVLPRFAYRAEMGGVVENEMCPVFAGWVDRSRRLSPEPSEVAETAWVPWVLLAADVVAGRRALSPWSVEQIRELAALGRDPVAWAPADPGLLPPAAVVAGEG